MSNFNTPINAGGLLDVINDSNSTREELYICDREAYMAGRRGDEPSYTYNQREQDMHNMGHSAYRHLGSPA